MVNSLTKRPERGRAGDRQKAGQEKCPRKRQSADRTAHVVGRSASVSTLDIARREEEHALGQPVVDDVQQSSENGQPADADAENQDAHVLDARVSQHPLEVALAGP